MTFDRFDFYKDSKDVFILPTISVSTQMEFRMKKFQHTNSFCNFSF